MNDLEAALDKFIDMFVLCSKCTLPQTVLRVNSKKGVVSFQCEACGATTVGNMGHKLVNFILKNPPPSKDDKEDSRHLPHTHPAPPKTKLGKTEDSNTNTKGDTNGRGRSGSDDRNSEDKSSEEGETKPVNVDAEQVELLLSPGQDPLQLLKLFWKSNPPFETIGPKCLEFQNSQKWTDTQMCSLVFGSLFAEEIDKDFVLKTKFMSVFIHGPKEQKTLLFCLEKLCQVQSSVLPKISAILQNFYDQNLLDDDVVFDWFEEPNKKIPVKISREIREQGKAFMEWLENSPSGNVQ